MVFQTFTSFPHLPLELRNQIWTLSIQPRIVNITSTYAILNTPSYDRRQSSYLPVLLQVCRESRALGLTHYIILKFDILDLPPPPEESSLGVYFSPIHDILYLPPHGFSLPDLSRKIMYLNGSFFPKIRNLAIGCSLGFFIAPRDTESLPSLLYPQDTPLSPVISDGEMRRNISIHSLWVRRLLTFQHLKQLLFVETVIRNGENKHLDLEDRKDEPLVAIDCDVADVFDDSEIDSDRLVDAYEERIKEVQKVTKSDAKDFFKRLVAWCEKSLEFVTSIQSKCKLDLYCNALSYPLERYVRKFKANYNGRDGT
jgi:hypothetical protein